MIETLVIGGAVVVVTPMIRAGLGRHQRNKAQRLATQRRADEMLRYQRAQAQLRDQVINTRREMGKFQ